MTARARHDMCKAKLRESGYIHIDIDIRYAWSA